MAKENISDDLPEVQELLKQAGFKLVENPEGSSSVHATIAAEPYPTGKDHFAPRWRFVSVMGPTRGRKKDGSCTGDFYYVTSSIHGKLRGFRCRHTDEARIGNIFASAPNRLDALRAWLEKYQKREYNK